MASISCLIKLLKLIILRSLRNIIRVYAHYLEPAKKNKIPEIDNELLLKPAVVIADNVRRAKITAKDVVAAYLKRIRQVDPLIKAVVDTNQKAIQEAAEIDEKVRLELEGHEPSDGVSINDMPLIGVPVSLKDLIAVKGLLITTGIYDRRNTYASEDARLVSNLRKAGAIPIVTTNGPEMLSSYDTATVLVGYTNNPYDLSRSPGGSSGGEGALIAAAASVIGVGSDVGGSIRIPGLFCGIFGHKPTSGLISNRGLFPEIKATIETSFVTGPMCRYASDLVPTLKCLAGDAIDKVPLIDTDVDLSKIRIFYMFQDKDLFKTQLQTELRDCVKKVVSHFEKKFGNQCIEVIFDETDIVQSYWFKTSGKQLFEEYFKYVKNKNLYLEFVKTYFGLSENTKRGILFAMSAQCSDFRLSEEERTTVLKFRKKFDALLGDNGVFISPTHPEVAPKRPITLIDLPNCGYTSIHNVIDAPTTHCPMGLNCDGLPVGLQVSAKAYNDHLTIAIAREIESAFNGWVPPCLINC
ncbi:hypothetical protein B4U80_11068 [Leptotrombidium deliense]|uniref:Amidase domain-containing protein n=1 Tax=Leptotrombidium deliense TaxID=299467 RepID=A0A443SEC6_9ACAR|nr:hypothetical protein B4U80_11068 [Leptotrombidium deliense]